MLQTQRPPRQNIGSYWAFGSRSQYGNSHVMSQLIGLASPRRPYAPEGDSGRKPTALGRCGIGSATGEQLGAAQRQPTTEYS